MHVNSSFITHIYCLIFTVLNMTLKLFLSGPKHDVILFLSGPEHDVKLFLSGPQHDVKLWS